MISDKFKYSWLKKNKALINVASIPIPSAVTLSIPLDAPETPRKILPPPTTIQICLFLECTFAISSAIEFTLSGSMP